ncbi:hypothetical protein ACQ4LE_004813 [Meloidogyne hapla]|uniref:aECM cysteine-cradle domain-containing protein n=1 Tax=Meloidogyne hapla TaxID=6305 RepID=A0A1I8B750_MELHA
MTLKLIKNKKSIRQSNKYFLIIPNQLFIYFPLLILFLPTLNSINEDNSQALVTRKILHRNGIKEFAVQKRIKDFDCACFCLCSLPNSSEANAQLLKMMPNGNFSEIIGPISGKTFSIDKDIRGNHCKCSCACNNLEKGLNKAEDRQNVDDNMAFLPISNDKEAETTDKTNDNTESSSYKGENVTETSSVISINSGINQENNGNNPKRMEILILNSTVASETTRENIETNETGTEVTEAFNEAIETSKSNIENSTETLGLSSEASTEAMGITRSTFTSEANAELIESSKSTETSTIETITEELETITEAIENSTKTSVADIRLSETSKSYTETSEAIIKSSSVKVEVTNETTKFTEASIKLEASETANETGIATEAVETTKGNSKMLELNTITSLRITEAIHLSNETVESHKSAVETRTETIRKSSGTTELPNEIIKIGNETIEISNESAKTNSLLNETNIKIHEASKAVNETNNKLAFEQKISNNSNLIMSQSPNATSKPLINLISNSEEDGNEAIKDLPSTDKKLNNIKNKEEVKDLDIESTTPKTDNDKLFGNTFPPDFKAKVANLLNRLKEQLMQLRQIEAETSENNGNEAGDKKSSKYDRKTEELLYQVDQQVSSIIKENWGEPLKSNVIYKKQKQNSSPVFQVSNVSNTTTYPSTSSLSSSYPSTSPTTISSSISSQSPSQSSSSIINSSSATLYTSTFPFSSTLSSSSSRTSSSSPITSSFTSTSLPPSSSSMPSNSIYSSTNPHTSHIYPSTITSALSSSSTFLSMNPVSLNTPLSQTSTVSSTTSSSPQYTNTPFLLTNSSLKEEKTNSTESISPAFKARLANLLNRLKEQLFRFREFQQRQQLFLLQKDNNINESSQTNTPPFASSTSSSENSTEAASKTTNNKTEANEENLFAFVTEPAIIETSLSSQNEEESVNKITNSTSTPLGTVSSSFSHSHLPPSESPSSIPTTFETSTTTTPTTIDSNPIKSTNHNFKKDFNKINDNNYRLLFPLSNNDFSIDSKIVQKVNEKEEKINLDREKLEKEDSQIKRIILLEAPSKNILTRNLSNNYSTDLLKHSTTPVDVDLLLTSSSSISSTLTTTSTVSTTLLENTIESEKNTIETSTINIETTPDEEDNNSTESQETTQNIAPYATSLVERLTLARRLREEQVKLEMMEAVRQEQLGINEPDPQLTERKKEIEQRLLQLAHAERFHRAMLERQKIEQQLERGKSEDIRRYPTTTEKASITPQTQPTSNENNLAICERVVRFIRLFKISRPRLWIETNCQFAKKHFPSASCEKIGALLNECLMDYLKEMKRKNKEDEERRENEEESEDKGR